MLEVKEFVFGRVAEVCGADLGANAETIASTALHCEAEIWTWKERRKEDMSRAGTRGCGTREYLTCT